MQPILVLIALGSHSTSSPQALLDDMRSAVQSGNAERAKALFAQPSGGEYLLKMAKRHGGLRSLKANVFPAPAGWGGGYWAIFHTYQDLEEDHDPVYEVVPTGDGLRLGNEIRESAAEFEPITNLTATVDISPADHRADIAIDARLKASGAKKSPIFRLNDYLSLKNANVDGKSMAIVTADDATIPTVAPGQLLRVGSLVVPQTTAPVESVRLTYSGVIDRQGQDQINEKVCYLTSWWTPSTARLPMTTKVTITGPKDWELRSEGVLSEKVVRGDRQFASYVCDLPISFPKVIGGTFKLAASKTVNGKLFRDYQLEPIDADRGRRVVESAASAVAFDEDKLAAFPFPGYDVFESNDYYGIESYSYTLLQRSIVEWATSHEIGHTYFGGMAPCPYVDDSWNEGLTQYWDSVVFKKNADRSLEAGLQSMRVGRSLSDIDAPWDDGDLSYYRGAYVMRMLENEVGMDKVVAGLKALVKERRGKSTTWADLRPIFEKAAGVPLDWFWDQWVDGAVFPHLDITAAAVVDWNGKKQAKVTVRQSGTPRLYRLRFKVVVSNGPRVAEQIVSAKAPEVVVDIPVDFVPGQAKLDVFGYTLATTGGPVSIGGR